jgi:hypothetical protein
MKKLILGSYFAFLIIFTIFSYFFIDPNLIYLRPLFTGIAFSHRLFVALGYLSIILISFIFYFVFLYKFKKTDFGAREFKIILAGTAIILLFSYPAMVSYDIFNYIATGKVLFFYHENPYLIMPIQFINDPLLLFTHAANKTALYAPVWLLLTGIPYLSGLGDFILTLFSFKLFNTLFYLATILVIFRISKNYFQTAIFAFNPLVIFEVLSAGHNDIVMMFLALISILCLKEKKIIFSLIFLAFSVLIKFATIFLLPIFILAFVYYLHGKQINWNKFYLTSSIAMFAIFLLSPIREEIYPWYAVWFLIFVPLIQNKFLKYLYLMFSFSLLLRDLPFMFFGTYNYPTPVLKLTFTFVPVFITLAYLLFKKVWQKNFSR